MAGAMNPPPVAADFRDERTGSGAGSGPQVSLELDCWTNGADPHLKLKHFLDSAISIDGAEHADEDPAHHIFKFKGGFVTGFSFVGAEFSGSPVRLARGQTIGFEETDSVTVGLHGDRIELRLNGVAVFSVDYNTGDVFAKGEIKRLL